MFIDIYTAIFIWTFAIFGLIFFILKLFNGIKNARAMGKGRLSVIISAKDQEDIIEGMVRRFIFEAGLDGVDNYILNVILVDAGSKDETAYIMERLERDYGFVRCLQVDELLSHMESM